MVVYPIYDSLSSGFCLSDRFFLRRFAGRCLPGRRGAGSDAGFLFGPSANHIEAARLSAFPLTPAKPSDYNEKLRRSGGTGRRAGLKIRWERSRASSILASGTHFADFRLFPKSAVITIFITVVVFCLAKYSSCLAAAILRSSSLVMS